MTDQTLLALRPTVATEDTATNPAEAFQNQTLRPVLKLQNELLLGLFRHYLAKRKQRGPNGEVPARFAKLSPAEQEAYIAHTIRTDLKFRNLLVGMVVGHFTADELAQFLADEAELTRRLGNLLTQRLQDQRLALV